MEWIQHARTWMKQAKCRGEDSDIFFPDRGVNPHAARRICADCPVSTQCLDYAVQYNCRDGVWGGYTGQGLHRVLRQRREQQKKKTVAA